MLRPGDRPLPSAYLPRLLRPGHLVDCSSAMDGAAVVIGDVIAREGAVTAWSIPRVGRSRGRTVPADPLPPPHGRQ